MDNYTYNPNSQRRFPPEVRERAVQLFHEALPAHPTKWSATKSIVGKIGCSPETLRGWVRQADIDDGHQAGVTTDEAARIKALEREVAELRRANEILRKASTSAFGGGGARPPTALIVSFIDDHREVHGVEPIRTALQFAPSTYYHRKRRERDPSPRTVRDAALCEAIERVHDDAFGGVYGYRKVHRQLRRQGVDIGRDATLRLMQLMGRQGATRGRGWKTTTGPGRRAAPPDLVERDFTAPAPDRLWVADFERHEAPLHRAGVKGLRGWPVAAGR